MQGDILHLPVSVARRTKYPPTAQDGAKLQSKEGEGKAGKGERKGQRVAFPSTPTTASPAPAPSATALLPPGSRTACGDTWWYQQWWQSHRDEFPAKAHADRGGCQGGLDLVDQFIRAG